MDESPAFPGSPNPGAVPAPDASPFRTLESSDPRMESEGLRFVTVGSPALNGRGDITLWIPEVPDEQRSTLPLAILLHGVYGSHWAWALKGGVHRTAARLVAQGEIPPLMLAMPSDGLAGDGTGYLPLAGADFERWIVDEVPLAARRAAGLPDDGGGPLFLGGLSMGGYGALRLGALHGRARIAGVSAHSSAVSIDQLRPFLFDRGVALQARADTGAPFDVLEAITSRRATLPPVRFDCGTDDFLLEGNRALHRALEAEQIAHVYEELPGAHDWEYWAANVERSLRFFGEILRHRGR